MIAGASQQSWAEAFAAAATGAVFALLGVSYYAVLWGGFGALFGLVLTPPESRWSALFSVFLSALVGAALGELFAQSIGGGQKAVIALSAVCGAGTKPIVSAAIRAVTARIEKAGGQ